MEEFLRNLQRELTHSHINHKEILKIKTVTKKIEKREVLSRNPQRLTHKILKQSNFKKVIIQNYQRNLIS